MNFLDYGMKQASPHKIYHGCHICGGEPVVLIEEFKRFYRVTSDCRPWHQGGKLGVCQKCGCVQKIVDYNFQQECQAIYSTYAPYHQSNGNEQRVFNHSLGDSQPRSRLLLKEVLKELNLPSKGSLLDVGCGNGNLLQSFSELYPQWNLSGSELNQKYKAMVERIKNFKTFYTCNVEEIKHKFNLITMLHSLEHIVDPLSFLKNLRKNIQNKGYLLVEVPNYEANPFDLVIADHCSHFDVNDLIRLFTLAGFDIRKATTAVILKEATILSRKMKNQYRHQYEPTKEISVLNIKRTLEWLKAVVYEAGEISETGNLGVFGTSIAGTWLSNELGNAVSFFVDEDPARIGKKYMKRQIYHPKDVPVNWNVLIALPYPVAVKVAKRLNNYPAMFYLPPRFD